MRITERDTLDGLIADLRKIKSEARGDMVECVRSSIRLGNKIAKDYATISSGRHARKYPGTFTAEMRTDLGLFKNVVSGEYGPSFRGQGELARILERGSHNNKPHLNLERSADGIAPLFAAKARHLPDKWFW